MQEQASQIKKTLLQYHLEVDTYHPANTEFEIFNALGMRQYLESQKQNMSQAQLLMLTIVDVMTIQEYENVKSNIYDDFGTPDEYMQCKNVKDLQKAAILAHKNLKDNTLVETAKQVISLEHSNLVYETCIAKTLG